MGPVAIWAESGARDQGPWCLSGQTTRLPPERTGVGTRQRLPPDFRVWESCRTMPLPLHSGAAPCSPHFALIGSRDIDVENRPNLST
ncbi:hypothetical protein PR048_003700 [Dryococelus australis]|uniref:Uncharacterized protein n=1 Tax=Dryococelus australis TaxID=614101 RepID=A0ABQ9INS1_9NEOP|nr:hypothetical protein PR048_003700 [Dryococelus australis]